MAENLRRAATSGSRLIRDQPGAPGPGLHRSAAPGWQRSAVEELVAERRHPPLPILPPPLHEDRGRRRATRGHEPRPARPPPPRAANRQLVHEQPDRLPFHQEGEGRRERALLDRSRHVGGGEPPPGHAVAFALVPCVDVRHVARMREERGESGAVAMLDRGEEGRVAGREARRRATPTRGLAQGRDCRYQQCGDQDRGRSGFQGGRWERRVIARPRAFANVAGRMARPRGTDAQNGCRSETWNGSSTNRKHRAAGLRGARGASLRGSG